VSGWTLLGVLLILAGASLGAFGLSVVGGLTILSRWLTTLWSRYGIARIALDRRLGTDRAVWGDEVPLVVEVWNQKLLPVPLVTVDDHVTDTLRVAGHRLGPSERPGQGVLRQSWSLLWFERVVRHLTIDARRRGAFTFGPARITVSDLFERGTKSEERDLPAQLIVRPRSVPVRASVPAAAPLGVTPVRASLFEDPSRVAGVRAYRRGDPMRRVNWRATARSREPLSRRYDPANDREVLLAIDIQTVPGPHWLMLFDDADVEALCVTAASLARRLLADGSACGVMVGAQLAGRIEDVLARIEPIVSLPFERLLPVVPQRLAPGGTLVTLSARRPTPFLDALRRIRRGGYDVLHVAIGVDGAAHRRSAADAGVPARVAELEPSWREADALVIAS
jgi:uncharacterized protein (DUF58 family)